MAEPLPALARRVHAAGSSRIRELLRLTERPDILSLAGGLPSPETFDVEAVRTATEHALTRTGPHGPTALQYGPTEGLPSLRALIAAAHGVGPEAVLITSGAQQALDLTFRALCDDGDRVALESPTYLGAAQAARAAGARLVAVRADRNGIEPDALGNVLANERPKVLYVVPNFHNPTGAVLPAARRERLAALAQEHDTVVIEDDPYRALAFAPPLPPSIATYGEPDRVVRVGSTSKMLAPGLRVGWLIGPRPIVDAAARLKQAADLHTSTFTQAVVETLLADAEATAERAERAARRYRQHAVALVDALHDALGERVAVDVPAGGMFCWVRATDGTDTDALFERAIRNGVAFVPGSAFAVGPDDRRELTTAMRCSYATLAPPELRTAAARLAGSWRAVGTGTLLGAT